MRRILELTALALALAPGAKAQQFEAASVKSVPTPTGFRAFVADAGSGGPGTSDPGMFRCGSCTLATLIGKAYRLQDYQFPAKASLTGNSFEIAAKIPAGATEEEFRAMLQGLLKERFALASHFDEKQMTGYHLTVAKTGLRLKESTDAPVSDRVHGGEGHGHAGAMNFNGQARYLGSGKTMGDLVRMLADQLGRPVDDQTGLPGKYEIALSWAADNSGTAHTHAEGSAYGGGDHAPAASASGDAASGPDLFAALQSQAGLKLAPANRSTARIFILDHIEKVPAAN